MDDYLIAVLENWLAAKSVHPQPCTVRCAQSQIPPSFPLWQNNTGGSREGLESLCMSLWLSPFSVYCLETPDVPFWLCHNNLHNLQVTIMTYRDRGSHRGFGLRAVTHTVNKFKTSQPHGLQLDCTAADLLHQQDYLHVDHGSASSCLGVVLIEV